MINGVKSKPTTWKYCVPQGSILGAYLYSDYTTPLGQLIRILQVIFHLYADDSQLFKSVKPLTEDVNLGLTQLQNCVSTISEWMKINKLKLNEDKTEFLVIGSKYHLKKVNVEHIILGEDCIP